MRFSDNLEIIVACDICGKKMMVVKTTQFGPKDGAIVSVQLNVEPCEECIATAIDEKYEPISNAGGLYNTSDGSKCVVFATAKIADPGAK